jgi:nitrite reductase/ring-hydroxylating ferredoxin subunit
MGTVENSLARRQLLQAGVAGAAFVTAPFLAAQSGCRSGASRSPAEGGLTGQPDARPAGFDAAVDALPRSLTDADAPDSLPEATKVRDGGTCVQTDYTRPVSIVAAGLGTPGTSTAFFDDRYLDPVCSGSRLLLIHPTTKETYVAMSGVCTHLCCEFTGGEGGPSYLPSFTGSDGAVLEDVVLCTCHGALFSALDGSVLSGPGGNPLATGLEILSTCEGGGFVFVDIPRRPS